MTTPQQRPNIEELLEITNAYARTHGVVGAFEVAARKKLNEVLFARGTFEAALSGVLTKEELVQLMFEHIHTMVSRGTELGPDPVDDGTARASIHTALFG